MRITPEHIIAKMGAVGIPGHGAFPTVGRVFNSSPRAQHRVERLAEFLHAVRFLNASDETVFLIFGEDRIVRITTADDRFDARFDLAQGANRFFSAHAAGNGEDP